MNKLAIKKPYVLLTHSGLRLGVTEQQQKLLVEFRNKNVKTGMINATITIEGTQVAVKDMREITTTEAVEGLERRKSGQWMCAQNTWHNREERGCDCKNPLYQKADDHPVIQQALKSTRSRVESMRVMIRAAVEAKAAEIAKFGLSAHSKPLNQMFHVEHSKCKAIDLLSVNGPDGNLAIKLCRGCGHETRVAQTVKPLKSAIKPLKK